MQIPVYFWVETIPMATNLVCYLINCNISYKFCKLCDSFIKNSKWNYNAMDWKMHEGFSIELLITFLKIDGPISTAI